MAPTHTTVHTAEVTPNNGCCQFLYPPRATVNPCRSQRFSNTSKQVWPFPIKFLFLIWVLEHVRFWVWSFKNEVFSSNPVRFLKLSPTGPQSQMSEDSSQCRTPRLESPMWDLKLLLLQENLCNIFVFQFVGHPPRVMRLDYIESALPTGLILVHPFCLQLQIFSIRFQSFSSMIVLQRVVILHIYNGILLSYKKQTYLSQF